MFSGLCGTKSKRYFLHSHWRLELNLELVHLRQAEIPSSSGHTLCVYDNSCPCPHRVSYLPTYSFFPKISGSCPHSSELSLVFYYLVSFGKQPCDCVLIQLGGFEFWLIISGRDVRDKMWQGSRMWPFPLTEDGKRWWLAVCGLGGTERTSVWETWVSLFSAPRPPRR